MALRLKLKQILNNFFLFGESPSTLVRVKNNAGIFEARTGNDSGYIIGRGADPIGPNDWLTKRKIDTASGVIGVVQFSISSADPVTKDSLTIIPAGVHVFETRTEIKTAFDGATLLSVANIPGTASLVLTSDVRADLIDTYVVRQDTIWPVDSAARATRGGAPTVGLALVTVFFSTPSP